MTVDLVVAPPRSQRQRPRSAAVALLEAVPGLEQGVPAVERDLARRVVAAPVLAVTPGPVTLRAEASSHAFAWIVLRGIVLRRTRLGDRSIVELLGEGDVVDLRRRPEGWSLTCRTEYVVHRAADVAVLDDRFRAAARRWPGLHDVVSAQLADQAVRASRQLATSALPRVEDRLAVLFTDLADRCGRVTPEGVVLDLDLTHGLLGELVGSRRPTVSLALGRLSADGVLTRRADRTWLLGENLTAAIPQA